MVRRLPHETVEIDSTYEIHGNHTIGEPDSFSFDKYDFPFSKWMRTTGEKPQSIFRLRSRSKVVPNEKEANHRLANPLILHSAEAGI
jgi:hypothetical protein